MLKKNFNIIIVIMSSMTESSSTIHPTLTATVMRGNSKDHCGHWSN